MLAPRACQPRDHRGESPTGYALDGITSVLVSSYPHNRLRASNPGSGVRRGKGHTGMGKLLVGRPTLTMEFVVSAPLDLVVTLVLVYRVPEMGANADAWCARTRAALDVES